MIGYHHGQTPETHMRYFPLFVDLQGQPVLVVGGGAVAERKIRVLLAAGAAVAVAAPRLTRQLREWAAGGRLRHVGLAYEAGQVEGQRLVFAATGDSAVNQAVFQGAEARGVLVNVVDDPAHCRFISPAIVERGPVQIAISTSGASPVLARRLRGRIEALLPAGLGGVAEAAQSLRSRVKRRLPAAARKRFWEGIMADANLLRWSAMRTERIRAEMDRVLRGFREHRGGDAAPAGRVYLVGAGPGNPDLLSLRALQVLGQADVILHDRLVPEAVLDRARRDADRVYVGKAAGEHQCSQREIERLMIAEARRGRTVVRLKGGDPFVFGRGGEEAEALRQAGVDFEIVPGITAATACAAYAGIPLTHRDHAQAVTLVTGHGAGAGDDSPDWSSLAGPGRTVAVYMGVKQAARIRRDLLAAGLPRNFPVAIVADGSLATQVVLTGTIGRLPELAAGVPAGRPGLLIIGQVAALGSTLCWFNESAAVSEAA
jgi:uroporphyrin-III C-methyltransferase/precorrin-2 dehydrogenase/sirohydrochlorin ferrochelatase